MTVEGTTAGRLRLAAKADAEPGKMVYVAVRPEKVRMSREPPLPGLDNSVAATVLDIGYLGEMSIYKLRVRDGVVKAAVVNTGGGAQRPAGSGDEVWLSWPLDAAILLTR
jgi:putrescine transport system ATP-binding protein